MHMILYMPLFVLKAFTKWLSQIEGSVLFRNIQFPENIVLKTVTLFWHEIG